MKKMSLEVAKTLSREEMKKLWPEAVIRQAAAEEEAVLAITAGHRYVVPISEMLPAPFHKSGSWERIIAVQRFLACTCMKGRHPYVNRKKLKYRYR